MKANDSQQLLADYVKDGSETAFRELVSRYINLVHSTASRLVNGDAHLAQDVTQMVFVELARKAHSIPQEVMLGGWLHRAACFTAGTIMRGERRRHFRERQAVAMTLPEDHTEANLALVAPVLDEAIDQLEPADRTAILLRFFERREFRAVGEALGSSEDAARMRVSRALDKLQTLLKNRGVALSAAGLGAVLAAEVVTAAPLGLAATVAGTALAGGAAGGAAAPLLKFAAMTSGKIAVVSAIAAAAVLAAFVAQHQTLAKFRRENQSLRQGSAQLAALQAENQQLSNLVADARSRPAPDEQQARELARLRGEVADLLEKTNELAGALAELSQPAPRLVRASGGIPVSGKRTFHDVTMPEFADFISQVMKAPVADQTGLTGIYDIEMTAPRMNVADGKVERVTEILLNDLGLRLAPFAGPFTTNEERAAKRGPVVLMKITNGLFTNINHGSSVTNQGFVLSFDHPDAPGLKPAANAAGVDSPGADLAAAAVGHAVNRYTPGIPSSVLNKLKLINAAKKEWALQQGKQYTNAPAWAELQFYLGSGATKDLGRFTNSPDGAYVIGAIGEEPQFLPNPAPAP